MSSYLTSVIAAHSGGALEVRAGSPLVWANQAITYTVTKGPLDYIADDRALQLTKRGADVWNNVLTASIRLHFAGVLNEPLSSLEYDQYAYDLTKPNLVFFDQGGSVVRDLEGIGQEGVIKGWGSPLPNAEGTAYVHFYSLMNGHLLRSEAQFLNTITHELGHVLGLDHTQIHDIFGDARTAANIGFIPLMYPTVSEPYEAVPALKPDDISWVSHLYPNSSFGAQYVLIHGRLVRPDNTPVLGANVIFSDTATSTSLRLSKYSCVSDWLLNNDGSFELALPPGTYRINIEPIKPSFYGKSSVGPYAQTNSDKSFENPIVSKEFTTLYRVDLLMQPSPSLGTLVAD